MPCRPYHFCGIIQKSMGMAPYDQIHALYLSSQFQIIDFLGLIGISNMGKTDDKVALLRTQFLHHLSGHSHWVLVTNSTVIGPRHQSLQLYTQAEYPEF